MTNFGVDRQWWDDYNIVSSRTFFWIVFFITLILLLFLEIINNIKCALGIHKYEERVFCVLDDGHKITEEVCKRCGNSPTWDRA